MIEVPIINIKCGDSDCVQGRHAFNDRDYKRLGKGRHHLRAGVCLSCGAEPVDFSRTHARDESDIEYLVEALQLELIRYDFWHRPFNEVSLDKAQRLGRTQIYAGIREHLEKSVGPEARAGFSFQLVPTDQDKLTNVLQYARHAIAACCRKCIHEWHGIPNDHPLTKKEIVYLSLLVERYLEERLPTTVPD
jgi:hypothetical protein